MFRIGQHPSNDLVLRDKAAEDYHCLITINTTGDIQVEDLQTRYGTLVNGRRIQRHTLKAGDELQIGFTRIEWEKLLPAFMELDRVEHLPDRDGDTIALQGPLDMAEELLHKEDPRVASPEELDLAQYALDVRQELIDALHDQQPKKELDYLAETTLPETLPDQAIAPKIDVRFNFHFTEHVPGKTVEPSEKTVSEEAKVEPVVAAEIRTSAGVDTVTNQIDAVPTDAHAHSTPPSVLGTIKAGNAQKSWLLAWLLLGILVCAWLVVMGIFAFGA